jgi:RNA polymerase sigma factor (sigma-70 family)
MPTRPAEHDRLEPSPDSLREEELFRLFCHQRDRGDADRAATMWRCVALRNFDRIRGVVQSFRFDGSDRIPPHDVDDAVQEAYLRVVAMGHAFAGEALGQFRVALKTCVENACRDFGRKQLRHARRADGSLDERYEDSMSGPYDAAIARQSIELQELRAEAEADEERRHEMSELVAWGIAQVRNDKYREVLELTILEPTASEEIAARLGITLDNVYQRRRRGMTQLEAILRDHHA